LGLLGFHIDVEGQSLIPIEHFNDPNLRSLTHYEADPLRIDFTLERIIPQLPPGAQLDACFAARWRLWTIRQTPPVLLRAEWEPGSRIEDGGLNGGEHLIALTWNIPGTQLSIGTADEEILPPGFEDERYWPAAIRDREGLQILVPPQSSGAMVQIQFLIAWQTGDIDENDASTWYAVDGTLYP
jgi:hypothetical protein